jgi:hypothetical protein
MEIFLSCIGTLVITFFVTLVTVKCERRRGAIRIYNVCKKYYCSGIPDKSMIDEREQDLWRYAAKISELCDLDVSAILKFREAIIERSINPNNLRFSPEIEWKYQNETWWKTFRISLMFWK